MKSRDWRGFLVVAVGVETVFALILRFQAVGRITAGERRASTILEALSLAWIPVLVLAAAGVGRSLVAARRQAARDERALLDVASTSHDWVWAADSSLRLTYSNRRVTELLGYQPEELYGRRLTRLIPDEHQQRAAAVVAAARVTGEGWHDVELNWLHRDGHVVPLQGTAVPTLDAAGVVTGFRGVRRKVTTAMASERSLLAAKVRITEALDQQALDVALQPVVSLTHGRLVGVEALARFRDGRSPDQWFPESRETGQSLALDLMSFRAALHVLPLLPAGTYLSVNASPELIMDSALRRLLLDDAVALESLVLEVTEHVPIHGYDRICEALAPLRERGVRLAVDDTGAGYASFNHVLQLRPDIIKIDRSLIAKITSDPARRSLVTALVLLALDLDASVTAEGVETPSELETLAALGVDDVQGYLLARPSADPARWQRWWTRNWLASFSHLASAADEVPNRIS
ncbi:MAG TPA: EAL domain-containing protein [Mycobacteriales bacterium]|nr:EAL domain-containing protein [Mycobacteriales bacterium]